MNYMDRHFGTGSGKYAAIWMLLVVGIGLGFWRWYAGVGFIIGCILVFWSQRNTK